MHANKPKTLLCCGILPETVQLSRHLKARLNRLQKEGKTTLTIGKNTLELFTLPDTQGCGLGSRIAEFDSLAFAVLNLSEIISNSAEKKAQIIFALRKTRFKKVDAHLQFFLITTSA